MTGSAIATKVVDECVGDTFRSAELSLETKTTELSPTSSLTAAASFDKRRFLSSSRLIDAAADVTATTEANVETSAVLLLADAAVVGTLKEDGLFSLLLRSDRLSVELMTFEAADEGLLATDDEDLVKGFLSPTDDLLNESKTALLGDLRCVGGSGLGGGAGKANGSGGLLFMAL